MAFTAAAIFAGGAAVSTIATVGVAAMSAFEVIAAVGAITSAVGVVTKSKELTAIGAIAGLAGGVGMFAQSQGWLGTAGTAGAEAGGLAGSAGAAEPVSNIAAMNARPTAGMEEALNASAGNLEAGAAIGGAEMATTGLPNTSVLQQAITEPSKGLINSGADPATFGDAGMMYAGQDANAAATLGKGPKLTPMGNMKFEKNTSIFDTLKGLFVDKDGKTNKEMLSMAGNFVGGIFDEKKKAETSLLKLRAEQEKQQMKNAGEVPRINLGLDHSKPLFKPPGPTYYGPQIGLINAR